MYSDSVYLNSQTRRQEQVAVDLQRLVQQQAEVAILGQQALETLDLAELMQAAIALVVRILTVNYGAILELLPNQAAFCLQAGVGWPAGWIGQVRVGADHHSQAGYTLQAGCPIVVEDLRTETRFSGTAFLHNQGIISGVSIPIQGKHKPYGVLSVHTIHPRTFSDDDVNFLHTVANILGSAVKRQQAEQELSEFFNLSLDLFCIAGEDGYFKRVNPRFESVLGYTTAELCAQPFLEFVHPDDRSLTLAKAEMLSSGLPCVQFRNRYRCRDGTYRWFSWTATPFDSGLLYAVARDITDRKQAEDDLQQLNEELELRVEQRTAALTASLQEKDILLKEIHHRVKNNLLVAANLLEWQSEHTHDPITIELLKNSQSRIQSMVLIHEKLYRSADLSRINFGEYLEDLVDHLFESYHPGNKRIDIECDIEPIALNIETANPCGLIVNELLANALKHAFVDRASGKIWLTLRHAADGSIVLIVKDNGIGFPRHLDFRTLDSLGMELVCTLTDQLEGSLSLDRTDGTAFQLTFTNLDYQQRI